MNTVQHFFLSLMQQEALKEILAALVLLRVDMLRPAWSSSESAEREKHQNLNCEDTYHCIYVKIRSNSACIIPSHLSDSIGQDLDDLVVRRGDDTLPVDFNDAVPDANASSLCYTAPHQTADLQQQERRIFLHLKTPQKASKWTLS